MWRREEYEALFTDAPDGARRGESTSLSLCDADALRRIRAAVPDARLIVLLRDPVDRAHSNWTHLFSAGLEPEEDFLAACDLEEERAAKGWATFWRYLDLATAGSCRTCTGSSRPSRSSSCATACSGRSRWPP